MYRTNMDKLMPWFKILGGVSAAMVALAMLQGGALTGNSKYAGYGLVAAGGALVTRGAQQILWPMGGGN